MLIAGLYCVPVLAADTFSLRGVTLGMHRRQVEKIETGALANSETTLDMMLLYELAEPVFGLGDASVFYYFTDSEFVKAFNFEEDRLYAMGLMFKRYVGNNDRVFGDYRLFIERLSAAYGQPVFYGFMEDGQLDYNCRDENFTSMAQNFSDGLEGRAFWYTEDFYICADLYNNFDSNERMIYMTGSLTPAGPTWNELTLKE